MEKNKNYLVGAIQRAVAKRFSSFNDFRKSATSSRVTNKCFSGLNDSSNFEIMSLKYLSDNIIN